MSIFTTIFEAIKNLFGDLSKTLKTAVHIGVTVTENIKNFDTANPEVADILTAIIPGGLDNDVKNWLRIKIPTILTELKLVDATLGLTGPNDIAEAAIKALQELDSNVKSAFLHNISVLVAQVASDGHLDWADGVYLVQWYYQHKEDL